MLVQQIIHVRTTTKSPHFFLIRQKPWTPKIEQWSSWPWVVSCNTWDGYRGLELTPVVLGMQSEVKNLNNLATEAPYKQRRKLYYCIYRVYFRNDWQPRTEYNWWTTSSHIWDDIFPDSRQDIQPTVEQNQYVIIVTI